MSFSINFSARSIYEARSKLHEAYAPAAVKALIEKALDAIPAPEPETASVNSGQRADGTSPVRQAMPSSRKPTLIGVLVEAWGHLADAGDMQTSELQRFLVKPLYG